MMIVSLLFLSACTSAEERELEDIHKQVIEDAIKQYESIKSSEDKIEVCVYAGMVTAAYVEAKNEKEAQKWKAIEDQDCKKAGIPMQ